MIRTSTRTTFFSVPITQEQKRIAWKYANKNDFAYRGDHSDGSLIQKYTGFLGEVVLADLLGQEWPQGEGFDAGIDFVVNGVGIDLKTQARKYDFKPYYVCNLMGSQVHSENYHNDAYLFSNINTDKSIIQFMGWISKAAARRERVWKDGEERERSDGTTFKVRGSLVEIKSDQLKPFISPQVFVSDVGRIVHPGF